MLKVELDKLGLNSHFCPSQIALEMGAKTLIQYVTDADGEKTAVIIPIQQWYTYEKILAQYLELEESIKEGMTDIKTIKSGEKLIPSVENFLDEL